ncbi:MAG: hypothetical protein KGM96_01900 [Acidobacteriota bacterium]|nr:hypothetical protein [Acidobacteriota bacterium]
MNARLLLVRSFLFLFLLAPLAATVQSTVAGTPDAGLVKRALAAELQNARNTQHPMRYLLRKSTPRLTSTKDMFETRDGTVARLVEINDGPLSKANEQKEQARLTALLRDPESQSRRKQSQESDTRRVLKVLHALPRAFIYQYAGEAVGPTGTVEKFTFKPNPEFDSQDLETQVLTEMTGEIWIDPAQERVARLEGHLEDDVDFGWGILGRLYKGGWIVIEQAEVSPNQWRIVRIQLKMNGRLLFANKTFDTLQEQTHFTPVPVGLSYVQAIHLLRGGSSAADQNTARQAHH